MTTEVAPWKIRRYDDGQEVMLKTVRCDNLEQSFNLAYHVAASLAGTDAEKDFSVSADPTALYIALHAYSKEALPPNYTQIAQAIDNVLSNFGSYENSQDAES